MRSRRWSRRSGTSRRSSTARGDANATMRPSPTSTALFLAPGVGLLLVFVVLPVLLTAWISLNNWSMYTPLSGMTFVGLENFERLLGDRNFRLAFRNTLVYAGLSLALILPLSFLLGQFLFTGLRRGRTALRSMLFVPYMVPTIEVAIIWGYLYSPLYGPLNQILRFFGLPGQAWLGSVDSALFSLDRKSTRLNSSHVASSY